MLTTRPLLPVYDRKALSLPATEGTPEEVTYASLADILTEPAEYDAHFSAYSAQACPYRLNKGILSILEDEHLDAGVPMALFVFDVDDPIAHATGTPARAEWLAAEAYKITSLLMKHEAYVYQTKGGYRVVAGWLPDPFMITSPADATFWTALYKTHVNALKRRFGIEADPRCADWQRQFRIPRACRDGVVQDLPTCGDPTTVGLWTDEHLIDADVVEPEAVRESKPRPGMRTDPSPGQRYLLAMKHAETLPPAVQGAGAENALWAACNEILVGFDLDVESALEVIDASYLPRCDVTKLGPEYFLDRARKKLEELNEGAEKPYGYILDARKMRNAPAFKNLPPSAKSRLDSAEKKYSAETIEGLKIRTLEDILSAFDPSIVPLPTPFETLNRITRGGLRRKAIVVLAGQPGAGKTGLGVQLGAHYLEKGEPVCFFAADEAIEFVVGRLGQRKGLSRDDIEDGKPHAKAAILKAAEGWKMLPVSSDWDSATLEAAAGVLHARWGPGVMVVDSAQRARTDTSHEADTTKGRVDDVVATMKQICEKYGHIMIVTSETNRSSYKSKDAGQNVEDIAAAKESGDIEYAAKLLLVLRVGTDENVTDVSTPKNRLGIGKPKWRLHWDYQRATFTEVKIEDVNEQKKAQDALEVVKAEVLATIRSQKCGSKNQVYLCMQKAGKGRQKGLVWDAIAILEADLTITKQGGFYVAL